MIDVRPCAVRDLRKIKNYLDEQSQNPAVSRRVLRQIVKSYRRLEIFPNLGESLTSKIGAPTACRFLVSGKYVIIYETVDDCVIVLRVFDSRRDYLATFLGKTTADFSADSSDADDE
ncbi:hypothetical protein FACS1894108_09460 [Planctomycetales bacterium]|nr:hypothetical protein FACS1894108_09460 [Planctomycetales bacterium]